MEKNKDQFIKEFNRKGFVVLNTNFSDQFLSNIKSSLLSCVKEESERVGTTNYPEYGLLVCAPEYGKKHPIFFDVFNNDSFLQPIEWILEKWFITYLYSSACLPPYNGKLKGSKIHVDLPRLIPNYNSGVAVMICVDEFTEENGCTYFLAGSQDKLNPPDEDFFWNNAERLIAPKGSVCYFNPRIWHAAGENITDEWRTSLLLGFVRPWMKQRIDIPRILQNNNIDNLSEKTKQLLGCYAQPPSSLDNYFGPKESRSFKQPFV